MFSSKKFTRKIEDFTCANCGAKVTGNGYTNHCPKCLWSKHVDLNPGDRKVNCGGLMKPIDFEIRGGEYEIKHRCLRCGLEKKNKAEKNDNVDRLIEIHRK